MAQHLLIVTEDGYGKRVAVDEVRRTARDTIGVNVSKSEIAAAVVVSADVGDVVIASAGGVVQRVAVSSIPLRRRSNPSTGAVSRGARVMALDTGDKVATVALQMSPDTPVNAPPPASARRSWPAGRVGLRDGESVRSVVTFSPVADVSEIVPGGKPTVDREEWEQTDVHQASSYWCVYLSLIHI